MTQNQTIESPFPKSFLASESLLEHLTRGIVGIAALVLAVTLAKDSASLINALGSLGLGVVALIAFRGCPICWTIGLFETTVRSLRRYNMQKSSSI